MSDGQLSIELRPIDRSNWVECIGLRVADDQVAFVANNAVSLAQAFGQREQRPFGIYRDGVMVGFLMYRKLPGTAATYVQRLMVDARHQRRGIGRAAMQALIRELAATGDSAQLTLSVEPANRVAIDFYRSLGFELTGTADEDGELDMSRPFGAHDREASHA